MFIAKVSPILYRAEYYTVHLCETVRVYTHRVDDHSVYTSN